MDLNIHLGHYGRIGQEMLVGAQARQQNVAKKGANLKLPNSK